MNKFTDKFLAPPSFKGDDVDIVTVIYEIFDRKTADNFFSHYWQQTSELLKISFSVYIDYKLTLCAFLAVLSDEELMEMFP